MVIKLLPTTTKQIADPIFIWETDSDYRPCCRKNVYQVEINGRFKILWRRRNLQFKAFRPKQSAMQLAFKFAAVRHDYNEQR